MCDRSDAEAFGQLRLFLCSKMAKVISTLDDAISKLNSLYEGDSTAPADGEEDYIVWTDLLNAGVNLWENEEGVVWKELFVKLADASDGDKTTDGGTSYDCPSLFRSPGSGYVWLGTGTNKTAYQVIEQHEVQLYENSQGNWCYFLMDTTPTLEFNPNLTIAAGQTISYTYYKHAAALASASDTFEMTDPMFAVFYALSELKKEEGDTSALTIATQKLESMKTRNEMPAWEQNINVSYAKNGGFGV